MDSVIVGGVYQNNVSTTSTRYNALSVGNSSWQSSESAYQNVVPTDGVIKKLSVRLSADAGTSPSAYRFTLRLNGVSTALTCTITADDITGFDLSNEVSVSAGDLVNIMCEPINSPSVAVKVAWSVIFTPTAANESVVMGICAAYSGSTVYMQPILCANNVSTATEANAQLLMPTSGTFKKLYVAFLNGDPGTPPSAYTVTLRVNSASSTLACTIVADNTTGNDTGHSVHVDENDLISIRTTRVSSPSNTLTMAYSMVFSPDTDGESLLASYGGSLSNSAVTYGGVVSYANQNSFLTTSLWGMKGINTCSVGKFHVKMNSEPYVDSDSDKFTYLIRKNGVGTALTGEVAGHSTTFTDNTTTVDFSAGDGIDVIATPNSLPLVSSVFISAIAFITPTSTGWSHKIYGVTPSKVMGIPTTSISKISSI